MPDFRLIELVNWGEKRKPFRNTKLSFFPCGVDQESGQNLDVRI